MISNEFFQNVKENAVPATWSKAVEWARSKRVAVESGVDSNEIFLRVSSPDRAVSAKVSLLLDDLDWTCDCSSDEDPCCHVLAATIALRRAGEDKENLPLFTSQVWSVAYDFYQEAGNLGLRRKLVSPDKSEVQPLEFLLTAYVSGRVTGPLISPTKEDLNIDLVLSENREAVLPRKLWHRIFEVLSENSGLSLDGTPVKTSGIPAGIEVVVENDGVGIRAYGRRQPGVKQVYKNGAVLIDGVLHPQQEFKLVENDLTLVREGKFFGPRDYAELTSEVLPRLRKFYPVIEETNRLPRSFDEPPRLVLDIENADHSGVVARPRIAYGEPSVAWLEGDRLVLLGSSDEVPTRDRSEELRLTDTCGRLFAVRPNEVLRFSPQGVMALQEKLGRSGVRTTGLSLQAYRQYGALTPVIEMSPTRFSADFVVKGVSAGKSAQSEEKHASWGAVWQSWRQGESMVPLLEGGFAPLPVEFLKAHGSLIQDLMAAKSSKDAIPELLWSDAATLATRLGIPAPRPFAAMREQMESFAGLAAIDVEDVWQKRLRPYQIDGVKWLRFIRQMNWGGLLADDMGLGKTVQTIALLEKGSLIVAPTSVIWNWQREIERFAPTLRVNLYHGPGRRLITEADVVVTSHGTLRADIEILGKKKWKVMVVDEAQAIKNPDSLLANAVCQCDAEMRLALSGTPVENQLTDLWSIFRFINPGFLGELSDFRDRYATPIMRGDNEAALRLRDRLRPFLLRRRKREVLKDLPLRTEVVLKCSLSEDERGFYQTLLAGVRGQLGSSAEVMQILEAILRLRQAACHRGLLPKGQQGEKVSEFASAKFGVLTDKLEEALAEGHKVLIFSQWTGLLDLIEPLLASHQWRYARIDGSTTNRQAVVDSFQSVDGPPILIMSLKAGGVGLNLTAADHVFIMDPWWNPAAEDQAADRAHRIGQTNPVMIYKLVAEGTIEERILDLQRQKRQLAEAAVDGGLGVGMELSKDELLRLLQD